MTDDGSNARFSLFTVSVQNLRREPEAFHCIDLPDETDCVPNTSAQPLPNEWRHLVRSIPHEEHPVAAPFRCHQRAKTIDGGANQAKWHEPTKPNTWFRDSALRRWNAAFLAEGAFVFLRRNRDGLKRLTVLVGGSHREKS